MELHISKVLFQSHLLTNPPSSSTPVDIVHVTRCPCLGLQAAAHAPSLGAWYPVGQMQVPPLAENLYCLPHSYIFGCVGRKEYSLAIEA